MDPTLWQHVITGVTDSQTGDRTQARNQLEQVFARTEPDDHAARCVIAHYLADLQADPADELRWDQLALDEHQHVTDADLAPVGLASAAALLPSLHLNLADCWLRSGDTEQARHHLGAARLAQGFLAQDPYAAMIGRGLDGLEARLAAHSSWPQE